MKQVRLGIAPIAWSNDDLPELGGDTSLETCLAEMVRAGYTGTETGGKFPGTAAELGPILERHGLALVSGWYSGELLHNSVEEEKRRARGQVDLFRDLGAFAFVYGETADSIQGPARGAARPPPVPDGFRDGRLRPSRGRVRRMGQRGVRRAIRLPPSHGRRRPVRGRSRTLPRVHRGRDGPPLRHRAPEVRGRRPDRGDRPLGPADPPRPLQGRAGRRACGHRLGAGFVPRRGPRRRLHRPR